MSRTHVVTGSASGIGEATVKILRSKGHRVIGVDIKNADVIADLSTPEGRLEMLEAIKELVPDGIDGVLTSAGASDPNRLDVLVATNYFGTIETIENLYPLLNKPGARCVTVSSIGMLQATEKTKELEVACLSGDEESAKEIGKKLSITEVYPATKHALTIWSRKTAVKPEWAGLGVGLNIVVPGVILTPMTARSMKDPEIWSKIEEITPSAVGNYAEAEDVAELMEFLLNCETNHLIGQIIYLDSGSEAIKRPSHS